MKVYELTGAILDYWVAMAEGLKQYYPADSIKPERFQWLGLLLIGLAWIALCEVLPDPGLMTKLIGYGVAAAGLAGWLYVESKNLGKPKSDRKQLANLRQNATVRSDQTVVDGLSDQFVIDVGPEDVAFIREWVDAPGSQYV